jgi:hypothetical protein
MEIGIPHYSAANLRVKEGWNATKARSHEEKARIYFLAFFLTAAAAPCLPLFFRPRPLSVPRPIFFLPPAPSFLPPHFIFLSESSKIIESKISIMLSARNSVSSTDGPEFTSSAF